MNAEQYGNQHVRLSDAERDAAMSQLGQAMAEGRLSIEEYDSRCRRIAAAQVRSDLDGLFSDLPVNFAAQPGREIEQVYGASEIEAAHRAGARPKAGVLGLTTVAAIAGTAIAAPAIGGLATLFLLLIPVVFILLYVMKLGPATWYAPSKWQLERNRLRELRSAERIRAAELRVQRKERQHELTSEAMNMAKNFLGKKRR
ncbi:DUF1707 SHOCT-like domain-containing protein [Corynebacterium halotolerans]|uniref:DUF1707 SHOCT-like domain-containing protein n=1 Tax=Corynebacterium halotolerans TaxID=225326 RepID=UPI003CF3D91F